MYAMYEEHFAERITQLRIQKDVSAREMSLAIGQNENYINRIENKKAFPSMQGFFYICEYLGITPKDFFDFESSRPNDVANITKELNNLTDNQLDIIISLVKEFQSKK